MDTLPQKLPGDPMPILSQWLEDARADGGLPNPDAMALATVRPSGQPAVRIVLCKQIVVDPGYLVFYTNYKSDKAEAIESNPLVSATFHWDHLNRQARVEGIARRSPAAESDAYFATRDKESQIGAWASNQSAPLESRQMLKARHAATARKLSNLAMDSGIMDIPRPPFWGGYRIWVTRVELWMRGAARLHDRGSWERSIELTSEAAADVGEWQSTRLQP